MRVLMLTWEFPPRVGRWRRPPTSTGSATRWRAAGHDVVAAHARPTRARRPTALTGGVRVLRARTDLPWLPDDDLVARVASANHHLVQLSTRLGAVAARRRPRPRLAGRLGRRHARRAARRPARRHVPRHRARPPRRPRPARASRARSTPSSRGSPTGPTTVLANSRFMVREIVGGFELPAERTPPASPTASTRRGGRPGEAPGTARSRSCSRGAACSTRRGSRSWPRAMQPAASPRARASRCVIGGRGSYLPELQSQIDVEGVSDIIELPGFLPDDQLRDTRPPRRVRRHPVAVRAVRHRRPRGAWPAVRRSSSPAPADWPSSSTDTGAGLLFEPGNAAELAACIELVLTRRGPRRRDAQARRRAARRPLLVAGDRRGHGERVRRPSVGALSRVRPVGESPESPSETWSGSVTFAPMRPVRRFEVTPAIPPPLAALPDLASNLHWSWDPEATRLFARIWPGWRPGIAHPAEMVRTTAADRLDRARQRRRHHQRRRHGRPPPADGDQGLDVVRWRGRARRCQARRLLLARVRHQRGACRSTRAVSACSPATTSRRRRTSASRWSASACMYTEGYFRQRLDADGWQQESIADFTPQSLGFVRHRRRGHGRPRRRRGQGPRVAGRRRPHPALHARHRRRRQLPRRRRRHRPPLRRRRAPPPAPGDRARHRRRARPARARPRARRCSTSTRATPASSASSGSASWCRRAVVQRRHRGRARRRRVHDPHPGAGRHRPLPTRADGGVLHRLRQGARRHRSTSCSPSASATTSRTASSTWP